MSEQSGRGKTGTTGVALPASSSRPRARNATSDMEDMKAAAARKKNPLRQGLDSFNSKLNLRTFGTHRSRWSST